MEDKKLFCTFYIEDFFYGIEVNNVQEVIREQTLTRVPLADHVVRGLINLRGEIVTAIDLRKHLGLAPAPDELELMNVIVNEGSLTYSLLVDRIGDVLNIEDNRFENTPDFIDEVYHEIITGVYKLNDNLMLCLDTKKIADIDASLNNFQQAV